MHRLGKIDSIQHFQLVSSLHQHFPALDHDRAFRIRDHIGHLLRHLHQIGFDIVPGLTGTGASDHDDVLVSGVFPVLRAAVHGQEFRLCQDYVVFEDRIHKRGDVFFIPP